MLAMEALYYGKETITHIDQKPLQFMHMQGKLQNDHHHKWSTYLQQFHLNIKYKKGNKNRVSQGKILKIYWNSIFNAIHQFLLQPQDCCKIKYKTAAERLQYFALKQLQISQQFKEKMYQTQGYISAFLGQLISE